MSNIRLHPNLVQAVVEALHRIFINDSYSDKDVPYLLQQHPRWGSRDRRFVAESIYDIVRWARLYATIAGFPEFPDDNKTVFASPENCHLILGVSLLYRNYIIENPELLGIQDIHHWEQALQQLNDVPYSRAVMESIPDWLDRLGESEWTQTLWSQRINELNKPPVVWLRVNTLVATAKDVIGGLKKEGIEVEIDTKISTAIRLKQAQNIQQNSWFKKGALAFQDIHSQCVGLISDAKPGMTVIDVCAEAGGKTLQLAALMNNNGKLIASDIDENRLKRLNIRAKEARVRCLQTVSLSDLYKNYAHKGDIVLVDAPCSGLGVLRRQPDLKWKLTEEDIKKLYPIQQDILQKSQHLVKPAGKLVYATCSVLRSECGDLIRLFINENKDWQLIEEQYWHADEGDFLYAAVLQRSQN